jgi:hypothetical protein
MTHTDRSSIIYEPITLIDKRLSIASVYPVLESLQMVDLQLELPQDADTTVNPTSILGVFQKRDISEPGHAGPHLDRLDKPAYEQDGAAKILRVGNGRKVDDAGWYAKDHLAAMGRLAGQTGVYGAIMSDNISESVQIHYPTDGASIQGLVDSWETLKVPGWDSGAVTTGVQDSDSREPRRLDRFLHSDRTVRTIKVHRFARAVDVSHPPVN